jgi:RNA polymerase sigma-70 factor (ECF subfamily)
MIMTASVLTPLSTMSLEVDEPWKNTSVEEDGGELIQAHLNGDQTAFSRLDRMYRNRLLNFINRMVRDRDRAEELVQETFLRVYRHGERFDQSRRFSTWIYTIAGNLARNDLRRRRRSPIVDFDVVSATGEVADWTDLAEDPAPRPDEAEVSRSMMELIQKTVMRLSPIHRRVFVLREIEDKTYEEIAEEVGCDLGTVKSRLNRARRAFAGLIAPYLD